VVSCAQKGSSLRSSPATWPTPKFIRDCLNGVNFPSDWWWILVVIKTLAVVGIWMPGVAVTTNVAVVAYFCSAAAARR
jgi:hypothetical protein